LEAIREVGLKPLLQGVVGDVPESQKSPDRENAFIRRRLMLAFAPIGRSELSRLLSNAAMAFSSITSRLAAVKRSNQNRESGGGDQGRQAKHCSYNLTQNGIGGYAPNTSK
jgi:hypothetical protein